MQKGSTLFLKSVLVLISISVLAGMVWLPTIEGRAANLDLISIYSDSFVIYLYVASSPFFFGIFQAFKLLGYIEENKTFSEASVKALRNIKYCAFAFSGFVALALPYIFMFAQEDDAPGVVLIGLGVALASVVIATAAGVFQKLLQSAVELKSENDLTV